eukprot:scaffold9879_cov76-Cyclotella_meneghiniana.AAC.3
MTVYCCQERTHSNAPSLGKKEGNPTGGKKSKGIWRNSRKFQRNSSPKWGVGGSVDLQICMR